MSTKSSGMEVGKSISIAITSLYNQESIYFSLNGDMWRGFGR